MADASSLPAASPSFVRASYNTLVAVGTDVAAPLPEQDPPASTPDDGSTLLSTLLELIQGGRVRRPITVPEQILGLRDQVNDNNGEPLAGGSIDVFAAGTTTRVTTYSDSALTQENANPVPLSGSGRANIWVGTREVDIRVLDATGALVAEELSLNPSNVTGGFNSGLVPNGSFELDSDADDVPDGWTNDVNETGSNNGLETGVGNTGAGAQSWRTQSTGNGGGQLVTSLPFEVNDFDSLRVSFILRSTVATVRNIVRVEWYDVSDVSISNTDVYDSTANPATFTQFSLLAVPPSGARLARIRLIGGTTGGTIAGITYWDNVRVSYPEELTGVFDNITIQNNEIISTNTNGNIEIEPNGTGEVQLGGAHTEVFADENSALQITNTQDGVSAADSGRNENQSNRIRFLNSQDASIGRIGFDALSRTFTLANRVWSGGFTFVGSDASGGGQTMFTALSDGAVTLYFAGNSRFQTANPLTSSTLSGAQALDPSSTFRDVGFAVNEENTATVSRAIAKTDTQRVVRTTGSLTLTFDQDSTIPDGAFGFILNDSVANVTLAQGAGVTLEAALGSPLAAGNRTLAQQGWVRWWKRSSTIYWITGLGVT